MTSKNKFEKRKLNNHLLIWKNTLKYYKNRILNKNDKPNYLKFYNYALLQDEINFLKNKGYIFKNLYDVL